MDCLFCKIIKREISAEVIYEDDDAIGFLDIKPVAPGHTIVLPKVHAENLLDLPDAKVGPVFLAVKKTTKRLKEILKPDAFTIGINDGRLSGQVVDHLHIHIIPRFKGDSGKAIHSVVDNPPKETLKEIAKKLSP